MAAELLMDRGKHQCRLLLRMANRHGLIAGATGAGKTVALRVIAEQLSQSGVAVFMADVKGDLSGIARPGGVNPNVSERAVLLGALGTRAIGSQVGREIIRGVLGSIFGSTLTRKRR